MFQKSRLEAAKEIFQTKNMTVALKGNKKKINIEEIESILKNLDVQNMG